MLIKNRFSRRDFLRVAGFASAAAALWGCAPRATGTRFPTPTASPIDWPDLQDPDPVVNALRRITLGPRPEEIEHARSIGLDAFIEEQLDSNSIEDIDVAPRLQDLTTLEMSPAELAQLEKRSGAATELIRATVLRAVYSRRQLYEQMVNFWSDHFNIYIPRNPGRALKTVDDREVIRRHALGNFRELLSASLYSPAMLVYLDNATSTKDRPNENYARELLELHTLGLHGGFTETDVREVARALTGWSVNSARKENPNEFVFRDQSHDDGAKAILGVEFPAGQGFSDGEQLATLLADHPSTASFIAHKLARRFVSDDPPPALVSQAAAAFRAARGDIKAMLSLILHSEEFRASLSTKMRRPFEFMVAALRQSNAETTFDRQTMSILSQMGQLPFHWPAADGYPDVGAVWLNSNDLLGRWNFSLLLAVNFLSDTSVDWNALSSSVSPEKALDELSLRFLGTSLPDPVRTFFLEQTRIVTLLDPVAYLGALLLASPYFQYR